MIPEIINRTRLIAIHLGTLTLPLGAQPAIPEPPVIFYGQISPTTPAPELSPVSFTLTGSSESLTTPIPAQVLAVDSQCFHLVRVPFETREVSGGGTARTPTPGTLAWTVPDTTYTLTAKVGSQTATPAAGLTTIACGAQCQGLVSVCLLPDDL